MYFRKSNSSVLLLFFCLATIGVHSQQTRLNGKITTLNGVVVEKVEIMVKNQKHSTHSDSHGDFTIDCKLKDRLIVSAEGFKTKTIKVKSLKDTLHINIALKGDKGYIELAATAGHLTGENIDLAQKHYEQQNNYGFGYTNMNDLIVGKFPQISLVNNEFIIRGSNSLSGKNGALIVLNGVISDIGTLQSIHVLNVKSISILTGTDAARYGSGSGNGVISVRLNSY